MFATYLRGKSDSPVMFPPGRARLATSPLPTGSLPLAMTIGIVLVVSLAARVFPYLPLDDHIYL